MSQTFSQILQSIPNAETRIAFEMIFEILWSAANSRFELGV